MYHLGHNSLLASEQMGFSKARFTTVGCLPCLSTWPRHLTWLTTLSFLKKLCNLGLGGQILAMLTSYLSNRYHTTLNDNTYSSVQRIRDSLPGRCAQPHSLSLLYQWYNGEQVWGWGWTIYAEDTVLFASGPSNIDLELVMNRNFDKLSDWATMNRLTHNRLLASCNQRVFTL